MKPAAFRQGRADSESGTAADAEAEPSGSGKVDGIDVDLTQLSSTMVYSEVYAMVSEPGREDKSTCVSAACVI